MDCHEPHRAPNEKMQGIQWTERPIGALVAVGSLWPPLIAFATERTAASQLLFVSKLLPLLFARNSPNFKPIVSS